MFNKVVGAGGAIKQRLCQRRANRFSMHLGRLLIFIGAREMDGRSPITRPQRERATSARATRDYYFLLYIALLAFVLT